MKDRPSNGEIDKKTFLQRIRDKIIKQPTDIFNDFIDGNIPLNGGNLFATQEYLKAVFENTSLVKYNLLLDCIRTIRNIFTIEGDDLLSYSWQNIITVFLIYGAVGLRIKKRVDDDILQIYGVMNFGVDDDLSIKTCEGYLPTVLNRGYSYGFDKNSKKVTLNKNTAVFGTYGTEALSIIVRVMPFINARYRVMKIASGNCMYHNKKIKMIYGGGSGDELDLMVDSVTSDNSKVIVEFNPDVDTTVNEHDIAVLKGKKQPRHGGQRHQTKFESMIERDNVNKDAWVDYDKFTEIQNELLGVRFNGAKKKSRNTTEDVKSSNAKTLLIEKDLEMSLKNLVDDYNKKYGKNAILIKTHDVEMESDQQGIDDPNNEKENT